MRICRQQWVWERERKSPKKGEKEAVTQRQLACSVYKTGSVGLQGQRVRARRQKEEAAYPGKLALAQGLHNSVPRQFKIFYSSHC